MSRVTLRQLEYLVAAAETGSVTAASQRLYLSQSGISTALADLEDALGVQLFIRHARGLTLTSGGKKILAESRLLLRQADDLHNVAEDFSESYVGQLSVGCYGTLAPLLLPSVISTYLEEHPAVDLSVKVGSNAELYEHLRDGTCDVALLYDYSPVNEPLPADLTTVELRQFPPYVALPAGHPLAELKTIPLQKLQDEPLIMFDLSPGGEYFASIFRSEGISPTVRLRTTEFELVRGLVARGAGYSLLTQHTDIDVSYEDLPIVSRPLRGKPKGLTVIAAHLAGAHMNRRMAAFVQLCQRTFGAVGTAG